MCAMQKDGLLVSIAESAVEDFFVVSDLSSEDVKEEFVIQC